MTRWVALILIALAGLAVWLVSSRPEGFALALIWGLGGAVLGGALVGLARSRFAARRPNGGPGGEEEAAELIAGPRALAVEAAERRRAEAALRESEALYRAVFENASVGLGLADMEGNLLAFNEAMCVPGGYTREDIAEIGNVAKLYCDPDARTRALELARRQGYLRQHEVQFRRKDGTCYDAVLSLTPVSVNGRPAWQAVVEDVSERKHVRSALSLRDATLQAVSFAAEQFLRASRWEDSVQAVLRRLGEAVRVSRVYVFERHSSPDESTLVSQRYEWAAPGIEPQIGNPELQNVPLQSSGFERWAALLSQGELIHGHVRGFPDSERELLEAQDIRSLVVVPITVAQEWWGFMGFDECRTEREWPATLLDALRAAAGTLGAAIQRQQAETALGEAQVKYRTLVEQLPAIVYGATFGAAGWTSYISPQVESLLGFTQSEWLRDRELWVKQLHPDDRERVLAEVAQVEATQAPWVSEYRMLARDGRVVWVRNQSSLVQDVAGQPLFSYGLMFDITQRKTAEEALQASEQRFRTLIEHSSDAVALVKADGMILYQSPAATRMLGYAVDEFAKLNVFDLIHPDDTGMVTEAFGRLLRGQDQTVTNQYRYRHKDGHWRWVEATSSNLLDEPTLRAVVINYRDITERVQRDRELEAVVQVASALRTAPTRVEILPVILDQILDLLQAQGASLVLRDLASEAMIVELGRGNGAPFTGARLPADHGVTARVVASNAPYATADAAGDALFDQPHLLGDLTAVACVPLISQDQSIGALWVGRWAEFAGAEIRLITAIADIAANAIHRATLHEQTHRHLEYLQALHTVDLAISASTDRRVTLNILLDQATHQLRVDAADILLINPHLQTLEYAAGRGFRAAGITQSRLRLGECYAGRAALERRAISIPDLAAEGEGFTRSNLLAGEGFVAYYAVPLVAKGQVTGVLEVFHRAPLIPTAEWLGFLESLAGQAAVALDSAALFDDLQRSNLELTLAYDATIEGWSRALDLRDRETEGHTQRVTEMTLNLARALGLPEASMVHIRRGALLHDIGKMGIPDSILHKPGPLDEAEWAIMRMHPSYAYDMLLPIAYLQPALDIPYSHHEKWDGTGYPQGLEADQIPMAARVFAVVDVWDALRSDRPYRAAWPEADVLAHIRELAGSHFDPAVAEAFFSLLAPGD